MMSAAPGILAQDSIFTMNAFEPLFWMTCAYLVIRIIKTGNERLWIWFGVVAGIGLENKYSMMIFGAGIVFGLLLTNQRKLLANRWLWIGGVVAFVIFAPISGGMFGTTFHFSNCRPTFDAAGGTCRWASSVSSVRKLVR